MVQQQEYPVRVLFESGEWSVVRIVTSMVYSYHVPCGNSLIPGTHWDTTLCFRCNLPVPEGIQALVALHNWEKV